MIFTIYGFTIYDFWLRQSILTPYAALHTPRSGHLREGPPDARKEQNDAYKS
jgi:hypothetical protein